LGGEKYKPGEKGSRDFHCSSRGKGGKAGRPAFAGPGGDRGGKTGGEKVVKSPPQGGGGEPEFSLTSLAGEELINKRKA